MKYISKFFSIFMAVALFCTLTACGKISDPLPIEKSGYPHSYPRH